MADRAGTAPWRTVDQRHAPRPFSCHESGTDGVVLAVAGDLDFGSAAQLARHVEQVLRGRPPSLTIDLAEVGFMDSTGVSALVGAWRAAERSAVGFALASLPEQARRVLEITETIVLFRIV